MIWMCELFAMSSHDPATVTFSLSVLAEHGGKTAAHEDGWGIAYYEDTDVRVLRDTTCASSSSWVQFLEQQELRSTLVLSHIRKATEGVIAIKNTQPFSRELGGRMHTFVHNGHLPEIRQNSRFRVSSFRPVGDTDSEYAFCALLERIKPQWCSDDAIPNLTARRDLITEFASDLGQAGLANFLYCDSDAIFAHSHRRKQPDGEFKSPGLYMLHRKCAREDVFADSAGVAVSLPGQDVVLIASVPLTTEPWDPLGEGEVLVLTEGQVVDRMLIRESPTI